MSTSCCARRCGHASWWKVERSGSVRGPTTRVLDVHELAAGKVAALLARNASRDIFDVHALLSMSTLDPEKLRLGFVAYGAMNRKDWRTVSTADVKADANEVRTSLLPMLRRDLAPARQSVAPWVERLVAECRERMSIVLPLTSDETEFIRRLNDEGIVAPELITGDSEMRHTIRLHPGLRWKALNVKRHFGLPPDSEE